MPEKRQSAGVVRIQILEEKRCAKMNPLRFMEMALSLSVFGAITFTLCILWDLAFPGLAMTRVWEALLPGFKGISWGSYFLGLVEVVLLVVLIVASIAPRLSTLIPPFSQRAKRLKEGSHELGDLREKRSSKA